MKILHTSDWHLGHRLFEQSQHDEQAMFLTWLLKSLTENGIQVLLIAGDIFDNGAPSAQSQKLYYDFLKDLRDTTCKIVFIAGGNHDAPGLLDAPKALLRPMSIQVVGKSSENLEDEVFIVEFENEKLVIAAVPFLRDQDIRRAVAGESFDSINERYKKALTSHYQDVAAICKDKYTEGVPIVAMGHLFTVGGSVSDSEQSIYVGGLGDIAAEDFPKSFDYVALGHLHRAQEVQHHSRIRYSGSPYMLSFSEVGHEKQVMLIETDSSSVKQVCPLNVPKFRKIVRFKGSLASCEASMKHLASELHELTPWVEVVLEDEDRSITFADVRKKVEHLNLDVLKVSYSTVLEMKGIDALADNQVEINELKPDEVFQMKCKELEFDLDENPEIWDAFNEILQSL